MVKPIRKNIRKKSTTVSLFTPELPTLRQQERIQKKLEALGIKYGFDQKTARRLARIKWSL